MSRKTDWLEIAEAYDTPEDEATDRQRDIAQMGLCFAGKKLRMKNSYDICFLSFPWPSQRHSHVHTRQDDFCRRDLAILFSCMVKRDFDKLIDNAYNDHLNQ